MRSSIALVVLLSGMSIANAGEETITVSVPASSYAFSNMPPCSGWREAAHDMMRDEAFVSGVASANPVAGAVVGVIGQVDGISAKHGGELSKLWRNSIGGSKSQCVTIAFALPDNALPQKILLSNRNGGDSWEYPVTNHFSHDIVARVDRQDWSGWLDVSWGIVNGRSVVTATAVNWQHNAATKQAIAIRW